MILRDIKKFLEDHLFEDITIGNLASSGIIIESGGTEQQDIYQGLRYETLDFWVRDISYEAGYNIARGIIDHLHRLTNYETENYHIYFSHALGGVEGLDRDNEGKRVFKCSIRFIFRDLSDIS